MDKKELAVVFGIALLIFGLVILVSAYFAQSKKTFKPITTVIELDVDNKFLITKTEYETGFQVKVYRDFNLLYIFDNSFPTQGHIKELKYGKDWQIKEFEKLLKK